MSAPPPDREPGGAGLARYSRRAVLMASGAAAAGGAASAVGATLAFEETSRAIRARHLATFASGASPDWTQVRALFPISPRWIDMSAMLIASHPAPVADAIQRHRRGLDENPVVYLEINNRRLLAAALGATAEYLGGVEATDIALTDSTTMGVALVYHGLRLRPGDEILTTEQDYYVTHEALRGAASRSGASVRRFPLYDEAALHAVTSSELVHRIVQEIGPQTRVLALTWVHSSTGLRLPVPAISAELARINAGRDEERRVLFCLDAVHGIGCQDASFGELGCDFLMSGCHKWLFGPRGTGFVAGRPAAWRRVRPTIPSFYDADAYGRWMRDEPAADDATTAAAFMPGGFKSFEHYWALPEAFGLHAAVGKARIAARTTELASQLKTGLAAMRHVRLVTPRTPELSAGIVSFDVDGLPPGEVVGLLRKHRIVASTAPYATPHVRLTPSIRNDPAEIETVLATLHGASG